MDSKEIWRQFARQELDCQTLEGPRYVEHLADFIEGLGSRGAVVTYSAMADEVDLSSLASRIAPERLSMTRTPDSGYELTVHRCVGQPVERHRYGFTQPTLDAPKVEDSEIIAVLVPGLLFDQYGGRIGHGMGYYDRFLGRLEARVAKVGIATVGVLEDTLPVESHDVSMTHLATSAGIRPVKVAK